MKLLKIQLQNFQCHDNLTLNFNENLNVIYGDSGAGKSAIYKAIEFLLNCSDVSEDAYRQEGSKQTSVKGWFDSGFQVERIRSNSINRYILSKEGCEDKVFDTFGRETPEEIQKVFQIEPIEIEKEKLHLNFANQDQLNFILDSYFSDTFKAKLFNKLTGNELLDVLFKDCNSDGLRIGREIKTLESTLEQQENDLVESTFKYKELKKKCTFVKEKFEALQEDVEIYENLKLLSEKLIQNSDKTNEIKEQLKLIKTISSDKIEELKGKAKELDNLKELFTELQVVKSSIKKVEEQQKQIKVVNVNWQELKDKANEILELSDIKEHLLNNEAQQKELQVDLKAIQSILKKNENKLKEIWAKTDRCPLCKQEIKK